MKGNKFGRKKQMINGIVFDSIAESEYYLHLLSLRQSGVVHHFEMQQMFQLQPGYEKYGRKVRPIEYVADFVVYYTDQSVEVVDVKGHQTRDSRLKQKLFDYVWPEHKLTMMMRKGGEWMSMEEKKKRQRAAKRKRENTK